MIDAGLAPRVRQLSAEYDSARAYIDSALALFPDVGAELEEFAAEASGTRELIDLLREAEFRQEHLEMLQNEISQGKDMDDPAQTYRSALETYKATYQSKTTRQRYAQHPAYVEFRSRVWEVSGDGAMPPLIDMIPAEDGDDTQAQDDDEEIVVGGTHQQFKCPLTASLLEDPVKSTVCAHFYSRAAITEYIQQSGRNAACPAASCRAQLSLRTLEDAPTLKRRVERYARQVARREEERRGRQWGGAAVLD